MTDQPIHRGAHVGTRAGVTRPRLIGVLALTLASLPIEGNAIAFRNWGWIKLPYPTFAADDSGQTENYYLPESAMMGVPVSEIELDSMTLAYSIVRLPPASGPSSRVLAEHTPLAERPPRRPLFGDTGSIKTPATDPLPHAILTLENFSNGNPLDISPDVLNLDFAGVLTGNSATVQVFDAQVVPESSRLIWEILGIGALLFAVRKSTKSPQQPKPSPES